MTYVQHGTVQAADFSTFHDQTSIVYYVGGVAHGVNATWGYGQTPAIPLVVTGQVIRSAEWTALRDAIVKCAQHQGTTVSMPSDANLAVNQLILAYPPNGAGANIPAAISAIQANRMTAAPSSVTLFANQLVATRTTPWHTQVIHDFTVTFPDYDHLRWFFNSGGQIGLRQSLTGFTNPATHQNSFWAKVLARVGTVNISANATANSYKSTAIGAYQATSTFALIFTENSSTTYGFQYGGDNISIYLRSTTANTLEIQIQFNNSHTNAFDDVVSGTLSSNIDMIKATNPLSITAPTFSTITPLTSGT